MDFFKNLGKKDKKDNKPNNNPLANLGKNIGVNRKFQGHGQSLGGSKPGRLLHISLGELGSLGVKVEKSPRNTAIVSYVVPQSQAERAGLIRGDIVCHPDTGGNEEMEFDLFLSLARSPERPFVFDIRRIDTKSSNDHANASAETFNRKQAMIAAAEARERAAKARSKPIKPVASKPTTNTVVDVNADIPDTPQSDAAKRAVEAAKSGESRLAAELGYNPYEVVKKTAGQARTATMTSQHGAIDAGSNVPIPKTAPPKELPHQDESSTQNLPPVSLEFEDAYATLVTTNEHQIVIQSLGIMRKLIINATTKGQDSDPVAGAKFRRVRLSNAKIRAAITDVHGALDVMMACGFQLTEEEGESYLVFPANYKGPEWLPKATKQMENYESS